MTRKIKIIIVLCAIAIAGIATNTFDYMGDVVRYANISGIVHKEDDVNGTVFGGASLANIFGMDQELEDSARAVLEHSNWVSITETFNKNWVDKVRDDANLPTTPFDTIW